MPSQSKTSTAEKIMNRLLVIALSLICTVCSLGSTHAQIPPNFRTENLVAWCIAHQWDAENRNPQQRAELLSSLGLKQFAYNWRSEDGPQFDEEILQTRKNGIEYFAFWNQNDTAFEIFKKRGISPQIWRISPSPKVGSQEEKVAAAARQMLPFATRAQEIGSRFGLYNHGGWGGEPENLVAVCKELRRQGCENVGVVYNFHHAHEHIEGFAETFALMKPYLLCVNLNGMVDPADVDQETKENKIIPVGAGIHEAMMMQVVIESGYDGPIGILGHLPTQDVEKSLRDNLEGIRKILAVESVDAKN